MQMKLLCNNIGHLLKVKGCKDEKKVPNKQEGWKTNTTFVSWFLTQAPSELLPLSLPNNGRARLLHTLSNWDKNTDLGREMRGKGGGFMLICVLLGWGSSEGRLFDFLAREPSGCTIYCDLVYVKPIHLEQVVFKIHVLKLIQQISNAWTTAVCLKTDGWLVMKYCWLIIISHMIQLVNKASQCISTVYFYKLF